MIETVQASLIESEGVAGSIVINPLFWLVLAALWLLVFRESNDRPVRYKKYSNKLPAGSFTADGTTTKSDAEDRVRAMLNRRGYKTMPQATGLVVYGKYGAGGVRKITPDIIVYAIGRRRVKLIIEYDGGTFHGYSDVNQAPNMAKVCDDAERNQRYAELGYTVVRIRTGEGLFTNERDIHGNRRPKYWSKITHENDMLLLSEYDDNRDRSAVLETIKNAKFFPPAKWQPIIDANYQYVETARQQRALDRNQRGM